MLTFPAVGSATPPNEKRTVMPRRLRNSDLRTREYLTEAEVERLLLLSRFYCRVRMPRRWPILPAASAP